MNKANKISKKSGEYLHIWLPIALKNALREEAKKEKRTLQGQIHLLLETHYKGSAAND